MYLFLLVLLVYTLRIMKIYAVIMAGGKGERFWPKSRLSMPKQFLSVTDDGKTMIQHTVERLHPMIENENILIITNKNYESIIKEQLPEIPEGNILFEPCAKNTAPAIALGAFFIKKQLEEDAVMMVLPSDHLITHVNMFQKTLSNAILAAESGKNLVTIGIVPSYPETGYGYINFNCSKNDEVGKNLYKVNRFVEKPNLETAKKYVAEGNYLWNMGLFVWKVSSILDALKEFVPETYRLLERVFFAESENEKLTLMEAFALCKSESIDYAVMEKSSNILTTTGSFCWDDVGSWLALERTKCSDENGNVISGNTVTYDTENCIIQGEKKLIATVGLENLVIVDTEDAILICNKDKCQNIKSITEKLRNEGRNQYL